MPVLIEADAVRGRSSAAQSAERLGDEEPREPREPDIKKDRYSKATKKRRSMAIRAYVGVNGSFKTVTAIRDLLPSIDLGRPILSTVPIYLPETGRLYEGYIPFTSWEPLLDDRFKHADILMDEVTGIANARDHSGLPRAVQVVLDKLRKRDLTLSWTAPAWGRADNTIRSCTVGVTLCKGYLSARETPSEATWEVPAWRPKRLARLRTFDATDYEEFQLDRAQATAQKHRRLRPKVVEWWWGPGSRVFSAFDTFAAVSRVGEVLDGGRCAICGGARSVPKCSCGA